MLAQARRRSAHRAGRALELHRDSHRLDGAHHGVMHLDDHFVAGHLGIGQRRLDGVHGGAEDVDGLEGGDDLWEIVSVRLRMPTASPHEARPVLYLYARKAEA